MTFYAPFCLPFIIGAAVMFAVLAWKSCRESDHGIRCFFDKFDQIRIHQNLCTI